MDDKFYLQINVMNVITIFIMWLIVATIIGATVYGVKRMRGESSDASA